MSFDLREYQTRMLDETRDLMRRGVRRILIQSATGSGKTALAAHMLGTAAGRGHQSWFVVHRRELIQQSVETFRKVGVKHGVIAAGYRPTPHEIQIASVGSLARRVGTVMPPRLIVWDEAHHMAAASWKSIQEAFPQAFHVGLSATPCRLDGKGLSPHFDAMVCGPTVAWLIENGWLCPYTMFAPALPDLEGVGTARGDYVKSDLTARLDKPAVIGDAVAHYRQHAPFKRAIVFAFSIEHSKHVVAQFNAAGFPAAHVDGETEQGERDDAMRRFRAGEILILSNVELFGEGVDVPACEVVIELRPTQSLSLWMQHCGRVLRPQEGKRAIILDHAGNTLRHGFPDDEREWTLEGVQKQAKKSKSTLAAKICKECFAAVRSFVRVCPQCGHEFVPQERDIDIREGELKVADAEAVRAARKGYVDRDRAIAKSYEDLVRLGTQRGYKNAEGWAMHVLTARMRKAG